MNYNSAAVNINSNIDLLVYHEPLKQKLDQIRDSLLVEYDKVRSKKIVYQTIGGFVGTTLISGTVLFFMTDGFETFRNSNESLGAGIASFYSLAITYGVYAFVRPAFITTFGNTEEMSGSYFSTFIGYHTISFILGTAFAYSSSFVPLNKGAAIVGGVVGLALIDLIPAYFIANKYKKTLKLRRRYIDNLIVTTSPTLLQTPNGNLTLGAGIRIGF